MLFIVLVVLVVTTYNRLMLLFLTVVLICSSIAMMLLLYAKHWELTRNRLILASVRPLLSSASSHAIQTVEQRVPLAVRQLGMRIVIWIRLRARDIAARMLIAVEHALEAALVRLKHAFSPAISSEGASSAFLREVAEHKRKLTRVSRIQRSRSDKVTQPDSQ
jgi:hypothetical protein